MWLLLLAIIALSFWSVIRNRIGAENGSGCNCTVFRCRGLLAEAGWFVAEYGRQPWAIGEVLPTAVAELVTDRRRSHLLNGADLRPVYPVPGSIVFLQCSSLHAWLKQPETGRYHFEQSSTTHGASVSRGWFDK
ncbi:cytochrome ubiquinol oxidase subunit I [Escherichia coli]